MLDVQQLMQLENEARAKMNGNDDASGAGGGSDGDDGSCSAFNDAGGRILDNGSSSPNSSGGYRYAAIEQAMDASASGE